MNTNTELELQLSEKGATYSPLELTLPEATKIEDWADIGRKLCRTDQVLKWWLGDWAAFGLRKYGQLKEFADANNVNYQTLRNAAYISANVELSRRRDNLDWSKHAEVAALKPSEQERWLAAAEEEELPVAELRKQIRQSQGRNNALVSDGPTTKFITKALEDLLHWLQSRPADFWNEERKALWRDRLKPIVQFCQGL